jgi:hypothetical protein
MYDQRDHFSVALGIACAILKNNIAGAICGVAITSIWTYYLYPTLVYAATHYSQCIFIRVPMPPLGLPWFLVIGSVKSVHC